MLVLLENVLVLMEWSGMIMKYNAELITSLERTFFSQYWFQFYFSHAAVVWVSTLLEKCFRESLALVVNLLSLLNVCVGTSNVFCIQSLNSKLMVAWNINLI